MKKKYNEYVELGKELLGKIEGHKIKICEYALAVCEIKHGGISDHLYTIKDYAEDIGMVPKTLRNWLSVYRNVILKIDNIELSNDSFRVARRVDNIIKQECLSNNIPMAKRKDYKKLLPKKFINELYNAELEEKPFKSEYRTHIARLKNLKHALGIKDLSILLESELIEMMQVLDASSDMINDYLTQNRKRTA